MIKTDRDRAALAKEYAEKKDIYENQLKEKKDEIALLQKELRSVKEFRKNKLQITEELKEILTEFIFLHSIFKTVLSGDYAFNFCV